MYYVIKRNDHEYFTGDSFSHRQRDAKRFDHTVVREDWPDTPQLTFLFGAGVRFVKVTQRSDRPTDTQSPSQS